MNAYPHRAPAALRTIALFELAKGLLVLAAACGLLSLRHTDLHAAADAFLLRHGVDPEIPYRRLLIESVARATQYRTEQIAAFAFVYAVIRFLEGFGLWYGKPWAEWFAVISAGLYLPLEFRHLYLHPNLLSLSVVLVNIAIIFYLGYILSQQRARLYPRPEST